MLVLNRCTAVAVDQRAVADERVSHCDSLPLFLSESIASQMAVPSPVFHVELIQYHLGEWLITHS